MNDFPFDRIDRLSQLNRRTFLSAASLAGMSLALTSLLPETVKADQAASSQLFQIKSQAGVVTSLMRVGDAFPTEYILPGKALGNLLLRCRLNGGDWISLDTSAVMPTAPSSDPMASEWTVSYSGQPLLNVSTKFAEDNDLVIWTVNVTNVSNSSVEIGDLAIPLPMNTQFDQSKGVTSSVFKHSFISGHGSHIFWMRTNSIGPYLCLTPLPNTSLEYWQNDGIYTAYVHSKAAADEIAAKHGTWRQPHTSLILAPSASETYGYRLRWADGYDHVRQIFIDDGLIDVEVVPGMTVPSDLHAEFILRTNQPIIGVQAEHPSDTLIRFIGKTGIVSRYSVKFGKLGENLLTVHYGNNQHLYLEFFAAEPVETLIKKRGAFTAGHQVNDPTKWYNGLLAEWNMSTGVELSPDNYDQIHDWRIYEVTCDDPGLSKPAFLGAKNSYFPVQSEIDSLDRYIEHFVWGGLQRTTEETYSYGIYGILDWKRNRDSTSKGTDGQLHLWRCYDYPHIIVMYYGMYRAAKQNPWLKTKLTAGEYLDRALGTAIAMYTVPNELVQWSALYTGYYNEIVFPSLIESLESENRHADADTLHKLWESKVAFFVGGTANLFGSEYAFDSTGFESTQAIAHYAVKQAADPNSHVGYTKEQALSFMENQMKANIFCRGWLEPAYYYYGSDYRSGGGDNYTLSYMAQMGGGGVLDYALYFATDPYPLLRLAYASILSSWALMNTGTPESNYGYWFPGAANDGGAGGGFEPAAFSYTWLGQPNHRGSWFYSCEINLGYCGALRSAATILADDPYFGTMAYGGVLKHRANSYEIVPRDGVRRRFHAVIGTHRLHMIIDNARFAAETPIVLQKQFSAIAFTLESDHLDGGLISIKLSGLKPKTYILHVDGKPHGKITLTADPNQIISLPFTAGAATTAYSIS